MNKINAGDTKAISSNQGKLYLNRTPIASIKSFECKMAIELEDIKPVGGLNYKKYKNYTLSGTVSLYKVDSELLIELTSAINKKVLPEFVIDIVVTDGAFLGGEAITIKGVTFNELLIGKLGEESIVLDLPFNATHYAITSTF